MRFPSVLLEDEDGRLAIGARSTGIQVLGAGCGTYDGGAESNHRGGTGRSTYCSCCGFGGTGSGLGGGNWGVTAIAGGCAGWAVVRLTLRHHVATAGAAARAVIAMPPVARVIAMRRPSHFRTKPKTARPSVV